MESKVFPVHLQISPTKTSFEVDLDPVKGQLLFRGMSYPENAREFFRPVLKWVRQMTVIAGKPLRVVFQVEYFNTSTLRYLYEILELLNRYRNAGNRLDVEYWHASGSEDLLETWRELMDELDMPFRQVEYAGNL